MPDRLTSAKRRGQAALLMTAVIIPLAGVVGLVTDVGYMHYVQRSAQKAADAAAAKLGDSKKAIGVMMDVTNEQQVDAGVARTVDNVPVTPFAKSIASIAVSSGGGPASRVARLA